MTNPRSIAAETRAMLSIAIPVVIDQVGAMSMGVVDTVLVGRLGSAPLGAIAIGGTVYFSFMVFSWGVVSAVSPTVAQAFGARNASEIERSTAQGFWIALMLMIPGVAIIANVDTILSLLGQNAEVVMLARPYLSALAFGMIASLWYAVARAFTVGLGRTRITMVISVGGAALNLILDWALIYGRFGMPRLGSTGAGYATAVVQWIMLVAVLFYVSRDRELRQYSFLRHIIRPDFARIRRLVRLGLPIGLGGSMEHGIFALTAILMGTLGTIPLASHQVALNVAAFTFMIPLGIATATTTRVGHAVGATDVSGARWAGWTGTGLSAAFMVITALIFVLFPRDIVSLYSSDAAVLAYATSLLTIAGAFQLFDGIQVAAQGALRGLKDTTRPMIYNLVSYWGVALPAAYVLCFVAGLGGRGLWWGLTTGLAVASVLHARRFRRLTSQMHASPVSGPPDQEER